MFEAAEMMGSSVVLPNDQEWPDRASEGGYGVGDAVEHHREGTRHGILRQPEERQ